MAGRPRQNGTSPEATPNPMSDSHAPPIAAETAAGRELIGALLVVLGVTAFRIAYLTFELHPLFADEAQYWTWSRALDWGYYSKPPVVAWLVALTTALFGDGEFAIRLSSPVIHGATAMTVFAIGRALYDARVGFWAAVTYVTLPAVSLSSTVLSVDPALLLFWGLAFYAFVQALERDRIGWWLAAGVALGLALLSKYAAIAFAASVLLFIVLGRRWDLLRRPGLYAMAVAAAATFGPNLFWNMQVGFVTFDHVVEDAELSGPLFNPLKMLEFLGTQFAVFGPILFGALLAMLALWGRVVADRRQLLLLSFVVPLLGAITLQGLVSQANANWAAAAYVTATVAVVARLLATGRRRLMIASVAIHVLMAVAVHGAEPVAQATGLAENTATDPFRRLRGWDVLGERVAAVRAAEGDLPILSDERRYMAEFIYYAQVPEGQAFRWNAGGRIEDHYDLVANVGSRIGEDFLLLTRWSSRDVSDYFDRVERLPDIVVATHTDREIRVFAFVARGFQGYGNDDADP